MMIYGGICFSVQEDPNKEGRNKSKESLYTLDL